jgi:type IV secretion system protein TrbB
MKYSDIASKRRLAAYRRALGPTIRSALEEPNVVEVMVNPDGTIWIDRLVGGRSFTGGLMAPEDALQVIDLVADHVGETGVGWDRPLLSADLPETGERFQAVLPPVSKAPTFSIRKKPPVVFTLADYVRDRIMTRRQADILEDAIDRRVNLLVGGGTGSGKTTLLNALLALPGFTRHRVLIGQDRDELQCSAADVVSLLAREADPTVTIHDIIKAAMRLRPDRIVIGEVREGAPTLAMLKAWNTGHPGGLGTIHADSAAEILDRLEELVGEVTARPMHRLIVRTVKLAVFIERGEDGTRRVTDIVRPVGYEDGVFITEPVDGSPARRRPDLICDT